MLRLSFPSISSLCSIDISVLDTCFSPLFSLLLALHISILIYALGIIRVDILVNDRSFLGTPARWFADWLFILKFFKFFNFLWHLILLLCGLLFFCIPLNFLNSLFGPPSEIDSLWKFTVVVYFQPLHAVVVEFKPLQVDHHTVGKVFEVGSPLGTYFPIVLFTHVLVVSLQDVWLNVQIQGLLNVLFILDVERNRIEVFVSLADIFVLWFKGLSLIANHTSDCPLEEIVTLLVRLFFRDQLFDLVAENIEKLMGVLLHSDIDWLSIEFEI